MDNVTIEVKKPWKKHKDSVLEVIKKHWPEYSSEEETYKKILDLFIYKNKECENAWNDDLCGEKQKEGWVEDYGDTMIFITWTPNHINIAHQNPNLSKDLEEYFRKD